MVRQAVRPLSTNGPTSEFVDQRSRTVAFSVSVPVDRVRRVPRVSRSPAHRSSSTMTPVSAGRGSRQKKRVSFGSCPGQRQLQLTMIKKLRAKRRISPDTHDLSPCCDHLLRTTMAGMKLKLDLHDIYNRGADLDRAQQRSSTRPLPQR